MIVTAWILLVTFGYLAISSFIKYMVSSINVAQAVLMVLSTIISALSAGVIWGGLLG